MKKYLSLERNMRGFSYIREFDKESSFWKAMVYQRDSENDEVEWSVLTDTETGKQITEYRRGMSILIKKVMDTL